MTNMQFTLDQTTEDYQKQIAALEQNLDEMTVALTHAWNQLVPFLQDTAEADASQGLDPILQAVLAAVNVPQGGIYLLRDGEWLTFPPALPQRDLLSAYLQDVRSDTLFTWRYYDEGRAQLWLFAPIITNNDIVGYIGIANDDIQRQFTEAERRILIRMAERAAGQIGAIQLAEMRQREAAARRELEIASHIQRSIQPTDAPSIAPLDVSFFWEPAKQVGGDACGWFVQPDGTLNWFILDVSGKGLPAALAAVSLYTAIRIGLRLGQSPDAILRLANEEFYQAFTDSNLMATAAIFSLNPQTGVFAQANAGHPPTLIRHQREWHRLIASVPPIGVLDELEPAMQEISLEEGDVIIAYSDGFTEIEIDSDENLWGESGMLSVIPKGARQAERLANHIVYAAHHLERGREAADDKTLFVVSVGEKEVVAENQ